MSELREQIMGTADVPPPEKLHVPEWGTDVYVAGLTAQEFFTFQKGHDPEDNAGFHARLAIATVRDAEGQPVFSEADKPWLLQKSAKALSRIASVAARLNGLNSEAEVKN